MQRFLPPHDSASQMSGCTETAQQPKEHYIATDPCVSRSSEVQFREPKCQGLMAWGLKSWASTAHRYSSADGELYKDVEGVLEGLCSAISLLHGQPLQDAVLAQGLLRFWDGICCLLSAQAKPAHWLQQLLKALKLFEPETRSAAAGQVVVSQ